MPRPRIHADSADRVAAFRADPEFARLDVRVSAQVAETIASLADEFDTSKNHVAETLIRFALMNRNWRRSGIKI